MNTRMNALMNAQALIELRSISVTKTGTDSYVIGFIVSQLDYISGQYHRTSKQISCKGWPVMTPILAHELCYQYVDNANLYPPQLLSWTN